MEQAKHEGPKRLVEIPLSSWGKLDAGCAWRQFSKGGFEISIVQQVMDFDAEAVLGVDWSSFPVYDALTKSLKAKHSPLPPFLFLCYRVYSRTATGEDYDFLWRRVLDISASYSQLFSI